MNILGFWDCWHRTPLRDHKSWCLEVRIFEEWQQREAKAGQKNTSGEGSCEEPEGAPCKCREGIRARLAKSLAEIAVPKGHLRKKLLC